MKNPLLPACLLILLTGISLAQPPEEAPGTQENPQASPPVISDYKDAANYYVEWSKNVDNPDYYKTLTFEVPDEKTKIKNPNIIAFNDLPDIQKDVFYLKQAEECSNQLLNLEQAWSQIYSQLTTLSEDDKKALVEQHKGKPESKRPPTDVEVKTYLEELLKVRKNHAVRYEALIVSIFKKHKDTIPAADRQQYTQQVHAWNDRQKLINRAEK